MNNGMSRFRVEATGDHTGQSIGRVKMPHVFANFTGVGATLARSPPGSQCVGCRQASLSAAPASASYANARIVAIRVLSCPLDNSRVGTALHACHTNSSVARPVLYRGCHSRPNLAAQVNAF